MLPNRNFIIVVSLGVGTTLALLILFTFLKSSQLFGTKNDNNLGIDTLILYKDPSDTFGRTVIFDESAEVTHFPGVGEIYGFSTGESDFQYIIGIFRGWEAISGSSDRYMLLYDPVNKINLKRVRVAFEDSSLFNGKVNATSLWLEDISKSPSALEDLGYFMDMEEKAIEELMGNGDVVIASFFGLDSIVKDSGGELAASKIYIRRYGDKSSLKFD